jgi:hypothetical protein
MKTAKNALMNFGKSFWTNIKSILFAFVLAVVIWMAISFQLFPDVPMGITVPISAELSDYMIDVNLELAEEFDETIVLDIRGRRFDIARLAPSDFFVSLDFTGVREAGEHEVPIDIQVREQRNFHIENENQVMMLKIIQTAEKSFWTTPDLLGVRVAEGMTLEMDKAARNPEFITIRGEKSLIDSIPSDGVRVVVSSDEPLSAPTDLQGQLVILNNDGEEVDKSGLIIENRAFTVSIPVFMRKTLELEIGIRNVPENFNLKSLTDKMRIEPSELTIASPDDTIANYEKWGLGNVPLSRITLWDLENGLPVPVNLPEGYVNMSGNDTARIIFEDIDEPYGTVSFNVPSSSFHTIRIPSGYAVNYITRQIPVKVVGPSSIISSMTPADIIGEISLAGIPDISPGLRSVAANFTVAGNEALAWVIEEYRIDIDIIETD